MHRSAYRQSLSAVHRVLVTLLQQLMHLATRSASSLIQKSKTLHLMQDEARRMEALQTKKSALDHRSADLQKRIRDLGTVPMDVVEQHRGQGLPGLKKQLTKVQSQLTAYG